MAVIPADELCLVVLIEASELQVETLGLPLYMLYKFPSFLEDQLYEIKAKDYFRVLNLGFCNGSKIYLGVKPN